MRNEARFVPGHKEVSMRSIPGLLVLPLLLIAFTARLNAGTPDADPIAMGADRGDAGEPEMDGMGQEPAGSPASTPILMGAYRWPDSTSIVLGQEPAPTGTTPLAGKSADHLDFVCDACAIGLVCVDFACRYYCDARDGICPNSLTCMPTGGIPDAP